MKKVVIIGSPMVHKNYQTALEKAGADAVISPDLSYAKKHPEAFDGLLLPGGGDVFSCLADYTVMAAFSVGHERLPTADPTSFNRSGCNPPGSHNILPVDLLLTLEQLDALDLFYKMNKPIFGICKGMQLINLYFHGTIREVSNRKLHQHPKKDVYHPADNLPGSLLHALFGPHMLINSNHHQCIDLLGQELQIIQHASDAVPEAVSHLSAPIIGTQWHPERMSAPSHQDALLLFRYFVSLL